MASEILVVNTLAFVFPAGAAQPTIEEMARFVKTFDADNTDMETAYKISEERSVFIKFKCESAMTKALLENPPKHTFHYANGKVVEVCMSVAGGNIRYVRVFDLPPEVSDLDVSMVLEKYGQIKRVEREKYPADLGLGDLFTGVRGIHMDIEKEIPPIIRFANRRGRIYYDQMKTKCYLCESEDHLRAACPKKKAQRGRAKNGQEQQNNSDTYAGVAGGSFSHENKEQLEIEVLEHEDENDECEKVVDLELEQHSIKRQNQQQQKQTVRVYQQKPIKYGNWTEYVQLHTKQKKRATEGTTVY